MRSSRRRSSVRGAVTLRALLFLLLTLLAALVGSRFGSQYGTLGAVSGMLVGAVVGCLAGLLAAFVLELFDGFWSWWRPYPPVCENGTCVGPSSYESVMLPKEHVAAVAGLSPFGDRCKCGNLYTGGYAGGFRNRWVRILPDGTIRPYLKHVVFGRWRRDEATTIETIGPGPLERACNRLDRVDIPGWLVPILSMSIFGAIAFIAAWRKLLVADPVALWMAGLISLWGFVFGCIAWYRNVTRS